eukprot:3413005-Rhodomonas_salina.1
MQSEIASGRSLGVPVRLAARRWLRPEGRGGGGGGGREELRSDRVKEAAEGEGEGERRGAVWRREEEGRRQEWRKWRERKKEQRSKGAKE